MRDFAGTFAKWKAAGLTWEPGGAGQGFLTGPDEVRIKIYANDSLATPLQWITSICMCRIRCTAQKWVRRQLWRDAGEAPHIERGQRARHEITLGKEQSPLAPTDGRSVDHIGFEVRNIDAFVAKLRAARIKTDGAIRNSTNAAGLRIVYITDPWGTEIEITEGLAATPVAAQ